MILQVVLDRPLVLSALVFAYFFNLMAYSLLSDV